ELLAPEKWDYIALGHYHTAQSVATNAWYSGSLEYLPPNPWGQLQDEAAQRTNAKGKRERTGKGYLLVDLPGARVTFRPVAPTRRHIDLSAIRAERLGQDVAARGDRVGDLRQPRGAWRQGLDPQSARQSARVGARRARVRARQPRVSRGTRPQ